MERKRIEIDKRYEVSEMKRAIIIAKGKVQKVGYRDFVQDMARGLNLTGHVENLKDGNVRIVCEGEEDRITKFIKKIKVKKDFIDVIDILVKYEKPTGEYEFFEIKYDSIPEELGDRMGAAILYLGATNKKIDSGNKMLGEKIDSGREENKEGFSRMIDRQDETISTLKNFREDTMERFDIVDVKYGKIAENMERAIEAINRTCLNTERLLEKTERDRKDFGDAIEKLADAIRSRN